MNLKCFFGIHDYSCKPFDKYDWDNDYPTEIVEVCKRCEKVKKNKRSWPY